ncbi:Sfi1-domain-containing protein [Clathrospora elynae]|uniref:Sfi1-domain-containing protein n=1 Tax=Clathrospora elynae TaxID=706981 RepID=A0A6A5S4G1_9PLEO|nr:Sfi1-domain-containing protein [Clathrospora elynae]
MLPSMSRHGYDATDLTKDDLTDEAIERLYEIVRRAQHSHDKSSRALFTAYGEVLEEYKLQPSDDAVLHRFLFHMQKHRRDGEALLQRFVRVLRESFEIDVEVNEDGEGIEVTTNLDSTRNGAQASLGRYSRRGSFNSFFDGTADKVAGTEHGDPPVRTRRASQQGLPNGHGDRWGKPRARSDTAAHSYQPAQLPIRNKVNGNAPLRPASGQHHPGVKRSASVSSRGSLQIRRDGYTGTYRTGDHDADGSSFTDRTTSLDLSHIQIPGVNAPIPDVRYESPHQPPQYIPEPFRPSDTRLMDDAETFEEQRLHRVTRECIQTWRNRTQERRSIRDDMERRAAAFDGRILMRFALEQWRDTMRARQSSRETNRFFDRLETRADKARSLFLLTKAFTHWATSAEDEVQRTSVARRHMLRTRFFNGWREITAVNELKIQHFALAKFLAKWRTRTATVRDNSEFAVVLYEENLVKRVFKDWFFVFMNRMAPGLHARWTARLTLRNWNKIASALRERDSWATDRRDGLVLRRTLQTWQQRTVAIQSQQHRADDFRHTTLLRSAFGTLQKQAQLEPLLRQFQARVNGRLVRNTFQAWQKDSQLSRKARNVDHMRVLRNAYTAWNDRLRIKALEDRINDRILVEVLYKWTLASRVSLFQRVHDRQLKQSTFLTWVTRTNQHANTLDAAERRFAQFKRAQLLRISLRKMEAITTERKREAFAVVNEYQQKLKQRIFNKLKEKLEHFQQLKQWSADARFYVLSKRTLKTWSEATQHARRNRRRNTYSLVRRTIKSNLVRRVFETWREKANHIAVQNQMAADMLENRTMQNSGTLLHQWHDRTLILRQQDAQASNIRDFKISTHYLSVWSSRMDTLYTLENQAIALRQESIEIAAASALKKLGWRLWNIHRQEQNARALYERNFEKHVRAMLRFWFEQTGERRAMRAGSPTPSRRSRGHSHRDDDDTNASGHGNDADDDDDDLDNNDNNGAQAALLEETDDETQRLETWTAFDENALGLNTNLDLELSLTPNHHSTLNPYAPPPPLPTTTTFSTNRPPRSILRRPNTFPQPQSALRPPQATMPKDDDESLVDFGLGEGGGRAGGRSVFWTGTPLPPSTTSGKPGYLKTPSKRSVVRAKRPELLAPSPEKRVVLSPVRRGVLERERGMRLGTMSAPPVQRGKDGGAARGGGGGGVTSFERRLREGGFGGSVAATATRTGSAMRGRGKGGNGKARVVGFGDV